MGDESVVPWEANQIVKLHSQITIMNGCWARGVKPYLHFLLQDITEVPSSMCKAISIDTHFMEPCLITILNDGGCACKWDNPEPNSISKDIPEINNICLKMTTSIIVTRSGAHNLGFGSSMKSVGWLGREKCHFVSAEEKHPVQRIVQREQSM